MMIDLGGGLMWPEQGYKELPAEPADSLDPEVVARGQDDFYRTFGLLAHEWPDDEPQTDAEAPKGT